MSVRAVVRRRPFGALMPVAVVLVVLVVNGFGEETAWRGLAIDRLVPDHGLRWSALVIVAAVWVARRGAVPEPVRHGAS